MYSPVLPCGKYKGRALSAIPTHYLRWALAGMESLDEWTRDEVRQELRRRGERFLPAAQVLDDLEQLLTEKVSEDDRLDHETAGIVSDLLLEAFETLRFCHGVGDATELVIAPPSRDARGWPAAER
jgi:hypothetical protein